MNIVFRTDASVKIGSGHVIRCLTLALFMREQGWNCKFVSNKHEGNLIDKISSYGFEVYVLEDFPESSSSPNWQNDALQTKKSINSETIDWLVVDHYELDERWEKELRPHVKKIFVIDDLANRKHFCDVLLDQNLVSNFKTRYKFLVNKSCRTLLGPKFALLQEEFQLIRETMRRVDKIASILVYFGGSDIHNLTGKTIEAFQKLDRGGIRLNVVLGFDSPNMDSIRKQIEKDERIRLHNTLPSLAPWMEQSDLAIGAAGATTWERCCLGLPSLVITVADNQKAVAEELGRRGLIKYLGHHDSVSSSSLYSALEECLEVKLLDDWSKDCMDLVDGLGTRRVCSALMQQDYGDRITFDNRKVELASNSGDV